MLLAFIFPALHWVDLVGSVIVAFFIIHAAWEVTIPALNELVDKGVSDEVRTDLTRLALSIDGVCDVYKLRTRFQGLAVFVDLHIAVDKNISVEEGHAIADAVEQILESSKHDVADALVHVDPYDHAEPMPRPIRRRRHGAWE